MSDEDDLSDDEWLALLSARPSTLPPFAYTFRGIDEAARIAMVEAMQPLATLMSKFHALDGLDGITIATDYRTALAELDRGVATSDRNEPTEESFGTGFAMSNGVVRDGRMKTHVTFEASIIAGISGDNEELRRLCQHSFMHELGHVPEHSLDWSRFGDAMLRPIDDRYEFELYRLSHDCWSEYYASRVSASWHEEAMDGLRSLLAGSLDQLRSRVGEARRAAGPSNRAGNDEAAKIIIDQVAKLMKFAGYVIGHARGADLEPLAGDSGIRASLRKLGLSDWFDELVETLDAIHADRDKWPDLSVFYPLHRSFEEACAVFRLELLRSEQYALAWRLWF